MKEIDILSSNGKLMITMHVNSLGFTSLIIPEHASSIQFTTVFITKMKRKCFVYTAVIDINMRHYITHHLMKRLRNYILQMYNYMSISSFPEIFQENVLSHEVLSRVCMSLSG